jgi:hypothetical protein
MITIGSEQMAEIERTRLEQVLEKIVGQFQSQYPDAPSAPELRLQMRAMLDQMLGWGIHSGGFLALHVFACKAIGIDYCTLPGFEAIFSDSAISDELKEEWLGGWMKTLRDGTRKNGT